MAETKKVGVNLGFFSNAFKDSSALQLLGVLGHERLSHLFEFELLLQRKGPPLTDAELEDVVRQPCVVALGQKEGDLVHGMLTSIEHIDSTRHVNQLYVGKMVPQVALLDLGLRCGIYEDLTIPEIVKEILSGHGLSAGTHFQIKVTEEAKSPKREYVVQYQESDWAFIQRWLEHEGYFYWFDHKKEGAKLVIADANNDASKIQDPAVISFRERNNLVTAGESTIWGLNVIQRRVPKQVTVLDYNHRRPTELLVSTSDVDKGGFGHVYNYGEHVKDRDVAKAVVKLRAELLASDRRVVKGTTDCSRFRVGHVFELENHFVGGYDGKYLITAVEHRAGFDVPSMRLGQGDLGGPENARMYEARFEAIPYATPFRPKRVTPWPRVKGLINGHVEADTSGDYAQIDPEGRYKVKMPFDLGNRKGLASSRWIRMSQAYAGAGYGQHFPLHKGTEVLLGHIDGDPDRPIIVGAVPNAATPGPVVDANATQSVMQTASGMRVEWEDLQQ
jgi:type VI secretion system secreted protein VgrG